MNLIEIHKLFEKEISFLNTLSPSKARVLRQNMLMAGLVDKLSAYYEKSYSEVFGFEINRTEIKLVRVTNHSEFMKSNYSADLFTIFIGPFSISSGEFQTDSSVHVLAECSSSSFYAKLSPFQVIHNSMNAGVKKAS